MKCWNCETEFEEGRICPVCGMEYEEKVPKIENNEKVSINEEDKEGVKFPWYLSIWFIVLFGIATVCLPCIPGVVLGIIRFCKYKDKRLSSIIIILVILLAYVFLSINL